MNQNVKYLLSHLVFGPVQSHHNLQLVPVFLYNGSNLKYLTLGKALEQNYVEIVEKNEFGVVGELNVINKSDDLIFLLDGEELIGAKQNRVLNTSVLVSMKSQVTIPVSCVEQSRWSFRTRNFSDSGNIMPSYSRSRKSGSVSDSLRTMRRFSSDQRMVWNEINNMEKMSDSYSPTNAMSDVYSNMNQQISKYLDSFHVSDDQNGVMAIINGEIAALEFVSDTRAFKELSKKIYRSLVMDALLENVDQPLDWKNDLVEKFINGIKDLKEDKYASVGLGEDYRYYGNGKVGSSLSYKDEVVHFVIFNERSVKW